MVEVSEVELNSAEWKGYVKRALESMDKKLDKMDTKMDVLDACVDKMKVRVACIGGTISLIVTILVLLLDNLLAK